MTLPCEKGEKNKVETLEIRRESMFFATDSPGFSFTNPLGLRYFPRQLVQMNSPLTAIDAIFNRPRDAAAVLFLIEDSSYMVPLWQHLRDSYLPSFLTAIKNANPSAPVSPFSPVLSHLPNCYVRPRRCG